MVARLAKLRAAKSAGRIHGTATRGACFPELACEDTLCQAPQAVQHRPRPTASHVSAPARCIHPGAVLGRARLSRCRLPSNSLSRGTKAIPTHSSLGARRCSGQPRSGTHRPRRRNLRVWSSRTQETQKRHIAMQRRWSMRARLSRRGAALNRSKRSPGRENIVSMNTASGGVTNARLRRRNGPRCVTTPYRWNTTASAISRGPFLRTSRASRMSLKSEVCPLCAIAAQASFGLRGRPGQIRPLGDAALAYGYIRRRLEGAGQGSFKVIVRQ